MSIQFAHKQYHHGIPHDHTRKRPKKKKTNLRFNMIDHIFVTINMLRNVTIRNPQPEIVGQIK